jgi:hypothetical protein
VIFIYLIFSFSDLGVFKDLLKETPPLANSTLQDEGPKCKDTGITYNPDYGKKSCKKKENPNPMVYP